VNNDGIQEIAFGSYDNKTYLLNSSNGQLIWSYATNNWVTSSPVIAQIGDSKKIIIASHDSKVYCFNADGTINWTFTLPTGGRIQSSPSIVDVDLDGMNDVIVGSSDSRLYALNSEGKLLWFYKVNAYIFSSPSIADINADGNMDFLFGSFDKNQYALDPPSWHFFGGNERRTRIYDISPPDILHFEVDNESKKIASLWQEKFSNLAYAVFTESSTCKHQVIMLKGMKDWVNLSFNYKGFYYTIEVFDEYNNSRKIEGYIEGEKDIIPPTYFGSQSMTEVYSPRKVYSIFLNWTDESGIEEIVLEHNFTGEIINESVSSNFVISDLPAGFYVWKSFAKDYAGNWNETEQFYLKVEKAQQQVNLFLQNSTYPNNITAICDGDKFYRNSILVANQDYSILPAGIWNYTCVKNENQNYSTSVKEDFLLVKKGTPVLTLFANSTNTCPSEIKVRAFENNTGDEDVVYILSNDTHNFSSRNITLSYKAKAGVYNFTYTSSEGRNWTSNSITQKIFVTDATKPINIRHRRIRSSQNITIETLWEDACSVVSKGLVTENSLGFYRNHTIFGINRLSYTFSENELKNSKGCMWFGRVCMKFVNYKILAFDEFNNHNSVEGTFLYMFLR
ncbi:MAG: PQQ-binding-like beta-propeller repeat protein, partial [Candidatus Aenigmarchaeota archaeon]|nr:PQQ-binding-like beta-propeller repeat protein [Candidatus Aenigmarchaeota archaeon]